MVLAPALDGTRVISKQPLEQLNLTNDLTGYLIYQTKFRLGTSAAGEVRVDGGQLGNPSSLSDVNWAAELDAVTLPLVITGRTNNAYIIAVDGIVVTLGGDSKLSRHTGGSRVLVRFDHFLTNKMQRLCTHTYKCPKYARA